MANTIQIKRSATTATPASLLVGELAYSTLSGNLFIGDPSSVITKIGGKGTADKADAALPSASFTDAAVVGKLLTGYSSTTGTVSASDSIVAAISKLNGNVAAATAGGISSISVTSANGVSGTSSGGTTPALTISLGVITPTSVNGLTLAAQTVGFTIAGGTTSKTMTFTNSLTISGTDGSTLSVGTGGTLGTAAYTATTAYATSAQGTLADAALPSASFSDTGVTSKLITNFVSGSGTVAATDTILQAFNKLDGNIGTKLASASFTDAAVVGKLLTGYSSTTGTLASSDSLVGAISKLNGNVAAAETSAKSYADGLVLGLWDDRGNYDASGNTWPSTGGSGAAGAIIKGDIWTINVAGALGGVPVAVRQTIRAMVDAPGTTAGNWAIALANTDIEDSITDGVTGRAPSQNAVFDALALKVNTSNGLLDSSTIDGGTF